MGTQVNFKNAEGQFISAREANTCKDYYQLNLLDNIVKTKHQFFNNVVIKSDYYMSPVEHISSVLKNLDNCYNFRPSLSYAISQ